MMKVDSNFKSRSGTWRLSNERMTVKIRTDAAGNIQIAAPIVRRFIGQPLNNLVRWMKNMSKTTITLLKVRQ